MQYKDAIEILDGSSKREGFQFEFKKSGTTKIKTTGGGDMNCISNYYKGASDNNPELIQITNGKFDLKNRMYYAKTGIGNKFVAVICVHKIPADSHEII